MRPETAISCVGKDRKCKLGSGVSESGVSVRQYPWTHIFLGNNRRGLLLTSLGKKFLAFANVELGCLLMSHLTSGPKKLNFYPPQTHRPAHPGVHQNPQSSLFLFFFVPWFPARVFKKIHIVNLAPRVCVEIFLLAT